MTEKPTSTRAKRAVNRVKARKTQQTPADDVATVHYEAHILDAMEVSELLLKDDQTEIEHATAVVAIKGLHKVSQSALDGKPQRCPACGIQHTEGMVIGMLLLVFEPRAGADETAWISSVLCVDCSQRNLDKAM